MWTGAIVIGVVILSLLLARLVLSGHSAGSGMATKRRTAGATRAAAGEPSETCVVWTRRATQRFGTGVP